jgi:hypothetical protein
MYMFVSPKKFLISSTRKVKAFEDITWTICHRYSTFLGMYDNINYHTDIKTGCHI